MTEQTMATAINNIIPFNEKKDIEKLLIDLAYAMNHMTSTMSVCMANIDDTLKYHKRNSDIYVTNIEAFIGQVNNTLKKVNIIEIQPSMIHQLEEMERIKKDVESIYAAGLEPIMMTQIKDCDFTTRTKNCLLSENIQTVRQLTKVNHIQLIRTPGLGRKSLIEIKQYLESHGLKLKGLC